MNIFDLLAGICLISLSYIAGVSGRNIPRQHHLGALGKGIPELVDQIDCVSLRHPIIDMMTRTLAI
jgi:hypothetical protein